MAISYALIGTRGTSSGSSVSTGGGTSLGGSKNHGVMFVSFDATTTISTVGDTIGGAASGNTWSQVGSVLTSGDGSKLAAYRCYNWNGGASHVGTVTFSGNAFPVLHMVEVRDSETSAAIDVLIQNAAAAHPFSVASGALAQANEVVFIFGEQNISGNDTENYTSSTSTIVSQEPALSTYWTSGVAASIVASTATANYNLQKGASNLTCAVMLISFKEFTGSTSLDLAQSGATAITGTLGVSGDISAGGGSGGEFEVLSPLEIQEIAGTLTASGDLTITGGGSSLTLVQTGAVAMSGVLAASGDLALAWALQQTGAVGVAGVLSVAGNVGFAWQLQPTGALAMSGVLAASGNVAFAWALAPSTLPVSGALTLTGDLAYVAPFTLAPTAAVGIAGVAALTGNVGFAWQLQQSGSITVNGAAAVSGALAYGSPGTLVLDPAGPIAVSGALTVAGDLALTAGVQPTAPVSVAGTVALTGDLVLVAPFALAPTSAVGLSGLFGVSGNLAASGPFAVEQAAPLSVLGVAALTGNLAADAPFTVTQTAPVALSGVAAVQGDLLLDGQFVLTVGAPLALVGRVAAAAAVQVEGGEGLLDPKFLGPSHNTRIRWERRRKEEIVAVKEANREAKEAERAETPAPPPPRSTGVGKITPPPPAKAAVPDIKIPEIKVVAPQPAAAPQPTPPVAAPVSAPLTVPPAPPTVAPQDLVKLEREMTAFVEGAVAGLTKQLAALEEALRARTDELAAARQEIADLRKREINRQRAEELARKIAEADE